MNAPFDGAVLTRSNFFGSVSYRLIVYHQTVTLIGKKGGGECNYNFVEDVYILLIYLFIFSFHLFYRYFILFFLLRFDCWYVSIVS